MLNLHSEKKQEIENLLRQDVQVFLLVGPAGIGKRTLIYQLCTELGGDVVEISSLKIDEARNLKFNSLKSSLLKKYYIISANSISVYVFNSLLKLLEEPPKNAYYFIVSTELPIATVVSRSHVIYFDSLSDVELFNVLKLKGMSERVARSVVSFADGSVERAFDIYAKMEAKKATAVYLTAIREKNLVFILQSTKIAAIQIDLMVEFLDDLMLSKYGIKYPELVIPYGFSSGFLETVRKAIVFYGDPYLNLLRAYYAVNT